MLEDPVAIRPDTVIDELDTNRDGKLDKDEVHDLLKIVVDEKAQSEMLKKQSEMLQRQSAFFKKIVISLIFALILLLCCLAGMAAAIVYFTKDTAIQGSTLVDKRTGDPVLVYSADFIVTPTGVLVSRDSTGFATSASNSTVPVLNVASTSSPSLPPGAASSAGVAGRRRLRSRTLLEELMYPDERDQPGYLLAYEEAALAGEDGGDGIVVGRHAGGFSSSSPSALQRHRRSMQQQQAPPSPPPVGSSAASNHTAASAAASELQAALAASGDVPSGPVPLSTSSSTVPLGLHSALPMTVLKELKYIQINSSSTGAEVNLFVLAVAKMPAPLEEGTYSSCEVLRLVTYVGTITVHGSVLEFGQDSVGDLFRDAGFAVQGSGRRQMLSGTYGIIGFFNFIKGLEIANLPPNEPKPTIAPIYRMKMRLYEECLDALDSRSVDHCVDPGTGLDRPGTTMLDGVRFMTTTQTVLRQHDLVLTTSEYPNFGPDLVRKELINETSGDIFVWQDLRPATRFTHCEYIGTAANDLDAFRSLTKDAIASYSFIGYEMKLGIACRHFRLTTRQPIVQFANLSSSSSSSSSSSAVQNYTVQLVDMEYWDTSDNGNLCSIARNNYPVAFEVVHPLAGISKVHIISFTAGIQQPASAMALPASFNDTNNPWGCPNSRFTKVPRMTGPFGPAWKPPSSPDQLDNLFANYLRVTVTADDPDVLAGLAQPEATSNSTAGSVNGSSPFPPPSVQSSPAYPNPSIPSPPPPSEPLEPLSISTPTPTPASPSPNRPPPSNPTTSPTLVSQTPPLTPFLNLTDNPTPASLSPPLTPPANHNTNPTPATPSPPVTPPSNPMAKPTTASPSPPLTPIQNNPTLASPSPPMTPPASPTGNPTPASPSPPMTPPANATGDPTPASPSPPMTQPFSPTGNITSASPSPPMTPPSSPSGNPTPASSSPPMTPPTSPTGNPTPASRSPPITPSSSPMGNPIPASPAPPITPPAIPTADPTPASPLPPMTPPANPQGNQPPAYPSPPMTPPSSPTGNPTPASPSPPMTPSFNPTGIPSSPAPPITPPAIPSAANPTPASPSPPMTPPTSPTGNPIPAPPSPPVRLPSSPTGNSKPASPFPPMTPPSSPSGNPTPASPWPPMTPPSSPSGNPTPASPSPPMTPPTSPTGNPTPASPSPPMTPPTSPTGNPTPASPSPPMTPPTSPTGNPTPASSSPPMAPPTSPADKPIPASPPAPPMPPPAIPTANPIPLPPSSPFTPPVSPTPPPPAPLAPPRAPSPPPPPWAPRRGLGSSPPPRLSRPPPGSPNSSLAPSTPPPTFAALPSPGPPGASGGSSRRRMHSDLPEAQGSEAELVIPLGEFQSAMEPVLRTVRRSARSGKVAILTADGRDGDLLHITTDDLEALLDAAAAAPAADSRYSSYHRGSGRDLQAAHSRNFSLAGVCSVSVGADGNRVSYGVNCGAPLPAFPLIELQGGISVQLTLSQDWPGNRAFVQSCEVSGCININIGVNQLMRILGAGKVLDLLARHGIGLSINVAGVCISYDTAERIGVLSGYMKIPNLLLFWIDWQFRLETNFEDCLAMDTASVSVQYRWFCGWSLCVKTALETTFARGGGCSAYTYTVPPAQIACPPYTYPANTAMVNGATVSTCRGYDSGYYLGCFADNTDRMLPTLLAWGRADMMPLLCASLARAAGLAFYGVQSGTECYGGNDLTRATSLGYTDRCTMRCTGDSSKGCGGFRASSVYSLSNELGCYADESVRAVPVAFFNTTADIMTPQICAEITRSSNSDGVLPFYSVQMGHACFGGADLQRATSLGTTHRCYVSCTGDGSQNCGGFWANRLYVRGDVQDGPPNLALGRPTYASSMYVMDGTRLTPAIAVDGVTQYFGILSAASPTAFASATGDLSPWISIDLGSSSAMVVRVVIWNRCDGYASRLRNAELRIGNASVVAPSASEAAVAGGPGVGSSGRLAGNPLVWKQTSALGRCASKVLTFEQPRVGRWVTLQNLNPYNWEDEHLLQLTELEVFGFLG